MAKWTDLKAAVAEVIKTNGNQEITGQVLQNVLNTIISNLGENATYAGIAIPTTNPGTPDGPVFYFAFQPGTYSNFNANVISEKDNMRIFYWNGTDWHDEDTGVPNSSMLSSYVKNVAMGTINVNISGGYSELDTYNSYDKKGWYCLSNNGALAGTHLLVTGDDWGHVVHQFLFGDYVLDEEGDISGHNDGQPSILIRTYNINSSTINDPAKGTWSKWRQFPEIVQTTGDSQTSVMSQAGVTKYIENVAMGTINVNIGGDYSELDSYNSYDKKGLYCLSSGGELPGTHLLVTGDDWGHVVHQFLFGDYVINDEGEITGHQDGTPSILIRTYNINSTAIEATKGTWTPWRYYQDTFIAQELGDEENKTISQLTASIAIKMALSLGFNRENSIKKYEVDFSRNIINITFSGLYCLDNGMRVIFLLPEEANGNYEYETSLSLKRYEVLTVKNKIYKTTSPDTNNLYILFKVKLSNDIEKDDIVIGNASFGTSLMFISGAFGDLVNSKIRNTPFIGMRNYGDEVDCNLATGVLTVPPLVYYYGNNIIITPELSTTIKTGAFYFISSEEHSVAPLVGSDNFYLIKSDGYDIKNGNCPILLINSKYEITTKLPCRITRITEKRNLTIEDIIGKELEWKYGGYKGITPISNGKRLSTQLFILKNGSTVTFSHNKEGYILRLYEARITDIYTSYILHDAKQGETVKAVIDSDYQCFAILKEDDTVPEYGIWNDMGMSISSDSKRFLVNNLIENINDFLMSDREYSLDKGNIELEKGAYIVINSLFGKLDANNRYRLTKPIRIYKNDNIFITLSDKFRANLGLGIRNGQGAEEPLYIPLINYNPVSYKNIDGYSYMTIVLRKFDNSEITDDEIENVNIIIRITKDTGEKIFSPISKIRKWEPIELSIDTHIPTNEITDEVDSLENIQIDKGFVYFPMSYRQQGKPTRLIIHCHGASTNYNASADSGIQNYVNSLLNISESVFSGYAVADISGMPGVTDNSATHCANPIAYQSYLKLYDYLTSNYNIAKDGCFVVGWSMGSLMSIQLAEGGDIPVLANVIYNPAIEFSRMWMILGNYFSQERCKRIKEYIAEKFSFDGVPPISYTDPCSDEEWKYVIDNIDKTCGYNNFKNVRTNLSQGDIDAIINEAYNEAIPSYMPIDNKFTSIYQMLLAIKVQQRGSVAPNLLTAEKKLYEGCSMTFKTPIKIFHNSKDPTTPFRYSEYYYGMLKRGGSKVEFRQFASGGHGGAGEIISETIKGVNVNSNALTKEILRFFKKYDKNVD